MSSAQSWIGAGAGLALALGLSLPGPSAAAEPAQHRQRCAAGAHTLSHFGDQVYPETGNGGYRSLHSDLRLSYDAVSNRFLPGNQVALTEQATQCLTDFSLDFERHSVDAVLGPDLTVSSVLVNGRPARFRFVQPTYPGDPHGQNDPDPRAHQAGQQNPVGGPQHNPLPPACTPQLAADGEPDSQDGQPCPATKLVITPIHPIRTGDRFTVTVAYTGRPGVHRDGDGTDEGWFRSDSPAGDGGFVTTEPVGSEDWMPVNDHPSAKPSYDFYDTVNAGKTVLANGILLSHSSRAPDANFPAGSTLWHWRSTAPVASYLVENSVGSYDLTARTGSDGVRYYQAQASSLSPAAKRANQAIMNQQPDITRFQSQFNGRYPFSSAGVAVGIPESGFEEEMQTMITFAGGSIDRQTFYHENMHQWWGDNVSEANYNLTFLKEGMATLGEYLMFARDAETAAGGPGTSAGRAAFAASLVEQFNDNYADDTLWPGVPSDPTAYTLFDSSSTYTRPGIAYLALYQILGGTRFSQALQQIQRDHRGATVTERQLESAFHQHLPDQSGACHRRLDAFFTQWFDTSYPAAGQARPSITGPGLAGGGFYSRHGGCS